MADQLAPLSAGVEAEALQAFDEWAKPQVEAAGWLVRDKIEDYLQTHKQALIEYVGPRIIAKFKEENGL